MKKETNRKQLSLTSRMMFVLGTLCVLGVPAHSQGRLQLGEFTAGERISADQVNANFDALAERLAQIESRLLPEDCRAGDILIRRDGPENEGLTWDCSPVRACPPGYALENSAEETNNGAWTVCKKEMWFEDASGEPVVRTDWVVKVSDFWIDRYEMTHCTGDTGDESGTGYGTTGFGCSIRNGSAVGNVTWFQATQLCANAGKRLCSNAEWQMAVSGTPDHGDSDGAGGRCVTHGSKRRAGLARMGQPFDDCVSSVGAEDMIGNIKEWVSDWQQGGQTHMEAEIQPQELEYDDRPWPEGYGDDRTTNVNGRTNVHLGFFTPALPAAVVRGGGYGNTGTGAGAFAYSLGWAPSAAHPEVGTRCCLQP